LLVLEEIPAKKWRIFARLNGVFTLNQKIRRQEIIQIKLLKM
jgi:hypothetical protein